MAAAPASNGTGKTDSKQFSSDVLTDYQQCLASHHPNQLPVRHRQLLPVPLSLTLQPAPRSHSFRKLLHLLHPRLHLQ